jgi:hypothetical protein
MEFLAFTFTLTFGTVVTAELSAYARTAFSPREIPWQSFPLVGEWTTGVLSADRRIRSVTIFQIPLMKCAKPALIILVVLLYYCGHS